MNIRIKEGVGLYQFNRLSEFPEIVHFITTRQGGFSQDSFASLNMGFHVGDSSTMVLQNRRRLAHAIGIDLNCMTFANQTHSNNVAIVNAHDRGKGAENMANAFENTDALVTNLSEICLCVQMADCVPVLLYDPATRVIGAVHAGWRGILKRIVPAAIQKMIQHYGCRAENIVAGVGPSNGPCCYEVEDDVKNETLLALGSLNGTISSGRKHGKFIFDQWNAVKMQLLESGLKETNLEIAGICNQCQSGTFFSNRAGKGVTGRYAAGIMLQKGI